MSEINLRWYELFPTSARYSFEYPCAMDVLTVAVLEQPVVRHRLAPRDAAKRRPVWPSEWPRTPVNQGAARLGAGGLGVGRATTSTPYRRVFVSVCQLPLPYRINPASGLILGERLLASPPSSAWPSKPTVLPAAAKRESPAELTTRATNSVARMRCLMSVKPMLRTSLSRRRDFGSFTVTGAQLAARRAA